MWPLWPTRRHLKETGTRRPRNWDSSLAVLSSRPRAASGNVCPGDDLAEPFVVGVVIAPDDVPADHAGLLLMGGVVGAVQGEIAQRGELCLHAV